MILLVSISMVMILAFTALTVDLGRLSGERRNLQDVADVVSLDVARELDDRTVTELEAIDPATGSSAISRAVATSAGRNNFTGGLIPTLGTKKGFLPFTIAGPAEVPNAVQIVASETVDFKFAEGSADTSRAAVATKEPTARFSIGSYLTAIDSTQNRILARVLGHAFDMQVVGYDGLVGATVTLDEIGANLTGVVLTPNEVLDASLTVKEILVASATALRGDGNLAAASVLDEAVSRGVRDRTVRLRDLVKVGPGGDQAAAIAEIDVLSLLVGSAFVVDHRDGEEHAFTLDELTAEAPLGLSGMMVQMSVISPPAYAFGPVGVVAKTAQVTMTGRGQAIIATVSA